MLQLAGELQESTTVMQEQIKLLTSRHSNPRKNASALVILVIQQQRWIATGSIRQTTDRNGQDRIFMQALSDMAERCTLEAVACGN